MPDQPRVVEHPLWCTRPGWTRAHVTTLGATLGAEQHFITACGKDYPLDDPETDEPTAAPADMKRCTHCTDVLEGRRA